jgi:hypothetical protein
LLIAPAALAALAALAACGARSKLPEGTTIPPVGAPDPLGALPGRDAGVARDAGAPDANVPKEAGPDVEVVKTDCTDPDATQIYVITSADELLAFDPHVGSFKLISKISCPNAFGATPFSMAVDRKGTAYSVFQNGSIYKIRTSTGACAETDYEAGQSGFFTFGMGFSTDEGGPSETLFVASDGMDNTTPSLASIDTKSFVLSPVSALGPPLAGMELTGTGDGRLFGFVGDPSGAGTRLVRVDKETAELSLEATFPSLELGGGWAFAFWGGDFWFFTAPAGGSIVTRYRPETGERSVVAAWPSVIVGAGVSTCAPEQ